jgi:hypothetical protein
MLSEAIRPPTAPTDGRTASETPFKAHKRGNPWRRFIAWAEPAAKNSILELLGGRRQGILSSRWPDWLPIWGMSVHTLKEAKTVIEAWRRHYNTVTPHSSLGFRPPAPEAICWLQDQSASKALAQTPSLN